jgi:hypothetical protein
LFLFLYSLKSLCLASCVSSESWMIESKTYCIIFAPCINKFVNLCNTIRNFLQNICSVKGLCVENIATHRRYCTCYSIAYFIVYHCESHGICYLNITYFCWIEMYYFTLDSIYFVLYNLRWSFYKMKFNWPTKPEWRWL